jgi:hypothetical protein
MIFVQRGVPVEQVLILYVVHNDPAKDLFVTDRYTYEQQHRCDPDVFPVPPALFLPVVVPTSSNSSISHLHLASLTMPLVAALYDTAISLGISPPVIVTEVATCQMRPPSFAAMAYAMGVGHGDYTEHNIDGRNRVAPPARINAFISYMNPAKVAPVLSRVAEALAVWTNRTQPYPVVSSESRSSDSGSPLYQNDGAIAPMLKDKGERGKLPTYEQALSVVTGSAVAQQLDALCITRRPEVKKMDNSMRTKQQWGDWVQSQGEIYRLYDKNDRGIPGEELAKRRGPQIEVDLFRILNLRYRHCTGETVNKLRSDLGLPRPAKPAKIGAGSQGAAAASSPPAVAPPGSAAAAAAAPAGAPSGSQCSSSSSAAGSAPVGDAAILVSQRSNSRKRKVTLHMPLHAVELSKDILDSAGLNQREKLEIALLETEYNAMRDRMSTLVQSCNARIGQPLSWVGSFDASLMPPLSGNASLGYAPARGGVVAAASSSESDTDMEDAAGAGGADEAKEDPIAPSAAGAALEEEAKEMDQRGSNAPLAPPAAVASSSVPLNTVHTSKAALYHPMVDVEPSASVGAPARIVSTPSAASRGDAEEEFVDMTNAPAAAVVPLALPTGPPLTEDEVLQSRARSLGYQLLPHADLFIGSNGNCFYDSAVYLSQHVRENGSYLPSNPPTGNNSRSRLPQRMLIRAANSSALRTSLAGWLHTHGPDNPFTVRSLNSAGEVVVQDSLHRLPQPAAGITWASHVRYLQKDKVWAQEHMVQAAAVHYKRDLLIISSVPADNALPVQRIFASGDPSLPSALPPFVLANWNNRHFVPCVPLAGTVSVSPFQHLPRSSSAPTPRVPSLPCGPKQCYASDPLLAAMRIHLEKNTSTAQTLRHLAAMRVQELSRRANAASPSASSASSLASAPPVPADASSAADSAIAPLVASAGADPAWLGPLLSLAQQPISRQNSAFDPDVLFPTIWAHVQMLSKLEEVLPSAIRRFTNPWACALYFIQRGLQASNPDDRALALGLATQLRNFATSYAWYQRMLSSCGPLGELSGMDETTVRAKLLALAGNDFDGPATVQREIEEIRARLNEATKERTQDRRSLAAVWSASAVKKALQADKQVRSASSSPARGGSVPARSASSHSSPAVARVAARAPASSPAMTITQRTAVGVRVSPLPSSAASSPVRSSSATAYAGNPISPLRPVAVVSPSLTLPSPHAVTPPRGIPLPHVPVFQPPNPWTIGKAADRVMQRSCTELDALAIRLPSPDLTRRGSGSSAVSVAFRADEDFTDDELWSVVDGVDTSRSDAGTEIDTPTRSHPPAESGGLVSGASTPVLHRMRLSSAFVPSIAALVENAPIAAARAASPATAIPSLPMTAAAASSIDAAPIVSSAQRVQTVPSL